MSHLRLGVNVDHVATVRQARRSTYPDPVVAAALAELAGADQITVHLREDRRHIQDRDVQILRHTLRTSLNLEMASTDEMVQIALTIRPNTVTLVPERRQELTTEGGLDVVGGREHLKGVIRALREADIEVSLFVDPDLDQVRASHRVDAQVVELHTGRFCEAATEQERGRELQRLIDAAKASARLGMRVAAGHGINYENVRPIAGIQEITELNIGHALVGRAVLVGMERAVRDMIELMRR